MTTVTIQLPDKVAECLRVPSRYKVLYGGRGGAKSWGVARYLLAMGMQRSIRVLCTREMQKSIGESVHKLLADQIRILGLTGHYEIQQAVIRGKNGTEFLFSGLKNSANLKSYEGVDICWVEEAQTVSKESWDILIPTIRREGSEIWLTFNPEFDDDETYQRFVVNPPDNARVVKVGWEDNPWFPEVLRAELATLKRQNINAYMHIWGGECVLSSEGAVFNMAWFPRYTSLPENPTIVHSWDTAYKAGDHNDPSCCTVWHCTPSVFYLAEVHLGKWEYPELRRRAFNLANEQKPHAILIEDKASGQTLIQEFRASSSHPVIAVPVTGDKETRARTAAAMCEANKILLPSDAPWLKAYERELMLFPSPKAHDDQVDSTSQFINHMRLNGDDTEYLEMMDRLYG